MSWWQWLLILWPLAAIPVALLVGQFFKWADRRDVRDRAATRLSASIDKREGPRA